VDDESFPQVDLPLILPDELEPEPERTLAAAPPPPPPSPRRPGPPPVPAPPPVAAAVLLSDDDGAADTAALSRAEPVLTETMAELFVKQGHPEDALRVYRALLVQRPGDARLRARIAAISGGGKPMSGQTVQAFLRAILAGRPGMPAPSASVPAASSLDSAFAETLGEAEPVPGEPSHAAEDTISLDAVFGDDGGRASMPAQAPPAAAAPVERPSPAPAPEPQVSATQTGGFSFDEFFGSSAARNPGSAPSPSAPAAPAEPKQPARPSSPRGKPPMMEEEGDLDQFQAWLKGLKT
jgi:hypothetical protein